MKVMLLIYLMLFPLLMHAQSFFAQKQTKLKYIAQQIALFELYAGYLKKGYKITQDGLKAINDIKHGDFDLHNNYFNSLKKVNTTIKNYAQADNIADIQEEILSVNDEINEFIQDNENIQGEEKNYIRSVMSNLLYECEKKLDQLVMLTTDSAVSMKDDERLKRLADLNADMKDKYSFAKHFEDSIKTLALSRGRNRNDANTSKLLYGIK